VFSLSRVYYQADMLKLREENVQTIYSSDSTNIRST